MALIWLNEKMELPLFNVDNGPLPDIEEIKDKSWLHKVHDEDKFCKRNNIFQFIHVIMGVRWSLNYN